MKPFNRSIFLACSTMAFFGSARGAVIPYPAPEGEPLSRDYRLEVDGKPFEWSRPIVLYGPAKEY